MDLESRPTLTLTVQGRKFPGLLDTGADTSIIATSWWPSQWPTNSSSQTLQGLGYESQPQISAQPLPWQDEEGHSGSFTPFILPLPVNLWGRDILKALELRLTNEHPRYSTQSQQMMQKMGHVPGKGLGAQLQGRKEPLPCSPKCDRKGLGFS